MTLILDGIFTITVEAGWMVLENKVNFAYFGGIVHEPLDGKTYMLPQGSRILARELGVCSGAPDFRAVVEKKEMDRLVGISKLVQDLSDNKEANT